MEEEESTNLENEDCSEEFNELVNNGEGEEEHRRVPVLTKRQRLKKEKQILRSWKVPKCGHLMSQRSTKYAGDYLLGPILGPSPVRSMVQCLARKEGSDKYYAIKLLTVRNDAEETHDHRQGKMLLHTEYSLLSLLDGQKGIQKQHGLFQDYACDASPKPGSKNFLVTNGKIVRRLYLVLDCVMQHNFDPQSAEFMNLQQYVIQRRKLKELEALALFYNIVSIVENLHQQNVVHKDLKLANLVMNLKKREVILTNFCLGQHLVCETDKLCDPRCSPAYISPDVLSGKPYLGKPSDMWALGVVLFTMLCGQFPFYDEQHQVVFSKIKVAQFAFPPEATLGKDVTELIRGLLCLQAYRRFTATQVLTKLTKMISERMKMGEAMKDFQVVPEEGIKGKNEEGEKEEENVVPKTVVRHESPSVDKPALHAASGNNSTTVSSRKLMSEFSVGTKGRSVGTTNQSSTSVTFITGDQRPLTSADMATHKNFFPSFFTNPYLKSIFTAKANKTTGAQSSPASSRTEDITPPAAPTQGTVLQPTEGRILTPPQGSILPPTLGSTLLLPQENTLPPPQSNAQSISQESNQAAIQGNNLSPPQESTLTPLQRGNLQTLQGNSLPSSQGTSLPPLQGSTLPNSQENTSANSQGSNFLHARIIQSFPLVQGSSTLYDIFSTTRWSVFHDADGQNEGSRRVPELEWEPETSGGSARTHPPVRKSKMRSATNKLTLPERKNSIKSSDESVPRDRIVNSSVNSSTVKRRRVSFQEEPKNTNAILTREESSLKRKNCLPSNLTNPTPSTSGIIRRKGGSSNASDFDMNCENRSNENLERVILEDLQAIDHSPSYLKSHSIDASYDPSPSTSGKNGTGNCSEITLSTSENITSDEPGLSRVTEVYNVSTSIAESDSIDKETVGRSDIEEDVRGRETELSSMAEKEIIEEEEEEE